MITAPIRLRIVPDTIVHVKRRIIRGKNLLKVHPGYEVTPDTVLGEGELISGYKIIDLAKILGVSPKDCQQYLKKPIGEIVYQGELIAEKEGFLKIQTSRVMASNDGVLESLDSQRGLLKIKLNPQREILTSGVYGIVDDVDLKKSEVTIRTQATIVYGIAGSGRERSGTLRLLSSDNPGLLVSSHQITSDFAGQIVVGGSMAFADALQKCMTLGVSALITGGVNATDYRAISGGGFHLKDKHWTDVGLTVLVTEGFGSIAIGGDIYRALVEHEGQFCLIDGNNHRLILPTKDQNSMMYIRKTVGSKGASTTPKIAVEQELKVGSRVRIVSAVGLGIQGLVSHIDQSLTVLSNGHAVIMVTVTTKGGKKQVAAENIEIY